MYSIQIFNQIYQIFLTHSYFYFYFRIEKVLLSNIEYKKFNYIKDQMHMLKNKIKSLYFSFNFFYWWS
jgi:hypothetical protein